VDNLHIPFHCENKRRKLYPFFSKFGIIAISLVYLKHSFTCENVPLCVEVIFGIIHGIHFLMLYLSILLHSTYLFLLVIVTCPGSVTNNNGFMIGRFDLLVLLVQLHLITTTYNSSQSMTA
jgi:hypothetical protein